MQDDASLDAEFADYKYVANFILQDWNEKIAAVKAKSLTLSEHAKIEFEVALADLEASRLKFLDYLATLDEEVDAQWDSIKGEASLQWESFINQFERFVECYA